MSGSVGGVVGAQVYTDPSIKTDDIKKTESTGSGIVGAAGGSVPDTTAPAYQAVLSSIVAMLPEISGEMIDVLLVDVVSKMKEAQLKSDNDKVKVDQEAKRTAIQDKQAKLDEATKKIEEAVEKQKNGSIWDKIKLAFQFLGAIFSMILGAALSIVPGLQGIGALMAIGGAVMLVMAIDTAVQMGTGMGIMGNIVKAAGGSEDAAKWADFGFRIGMAVVGIALAAATFFVNPTGMFAAVAQAAQTLSSIVMGSIGVMTAAGDIAVGAVNYSASQDKAEANKMQAEAKDQEALIQQLEDLIDQAIARMVASANRFNDMLDAITDAIQDRGNSLAQAKFRG